jgi:hypothetical protein
VIWNCFHWENAANLQLGTFIGMHIYILICFHAKFFQDIDLCTCTAIKLWLGSSILKQIGVPANTGFGVTDESLHFAEES